MYSLRQTKNVKVNAAMSVLTLGQARIVSVASKGHNLLITGQAGTGKSTVVEEIIANGKAAGLKVVVVCSSGIACTVYDSGVASTVHSNYGLGVADLPWKQLVERSSLDSTVIKRVKACDVLIWDEASMSSQRMLELVNAIHHRLGENGDKDKPFGGIQVILVGEFLQLRPVPDDLDEGMFMFHSHLFQTAISHRFELTEVMRQVNKEFLSALQEIRVGECSNKTAEYLCSLSRVNGSLEETTSHIYFKKLPVAVHNREALQKLPGPEFVFEAEKTNETRGMNWPGSDVLYLRPGCPVMLVWNLNDKLKNGSKGAFLECTTDGKLKVWFADIGSVQIERQSWYKRNRQGNIVGSVYQFPLVLSYAVTCHKSQGLTLPAAVVHCSNEFVPGLIYVALSRVKDPSNLQVLNFKRRSLLPPNPRVLKECSTDLGDLYEDLHCCRNKNLSADFFTVQDRYILEEKDHDETFTFPEELCDDPVASYYEQDDEEIVTDIVQVYHQLSKPDSELSTPPDSVAVTDILTSMKIAKPLTELARDKNACLQQLAEESFKGKTTTFLKLVWLRFYQFFKDHLIENPDEVIFNISRGGFTGCTAKLHSFLNSPEFDQYLKGLFNCREVRRSQKEVATALSMRLYDLFLGNLVQIISSKHETESEQPLGFNVSEMAEPGKAKIRHVGEWAIRRLLENERKYARDNIHTKDERTLQKVKGSVSICDLIEETLLVPYAQLESSTNQPETLVVTEARQFRERGLVHISDACFKVFMLLEQLRVDEMNSRKLQQHKQDLISRAYEKMTTNEELKALWRACFSEDDLITKKVSKANEQ